LGGGWISRIEHCNILTERIVKTSRLLWGLGTAAIVGGVAFLAINFAGPKGKGADRLREGSSDLQKFDNSLTFSNVTLEQADEKGQLWWKMKAAKATYSKDKKIATVEQPEGELYQDGKAIFKLKAVKGEVVEDGKSIVLKGDIIATDLRDGTVLQGKEIEWQPTKDLMSVRKQFVAQHKKMKLVGEEGRFYSRKREADILGQVVAEVKTPNLRMKTKQLKWWIDQERLESQQPLQIDRIEQGKVTDQAAAQKGSYNLKDQIATLQKSAQIFMPSQGLQAKSDELTWNLKQQQVDAKQPITLVNTVQQVTLTGDRGQLNLPQQTAVLTGKVRGLSLSNQANVGADNLTWFLKTQSFEANGNVTYQQISPAFSLVGTKATGTIQDQQVQITGGPEGDNRVVTEIVPNFVGQ
jgi:LPS export ABC transporter protein LptC